MEKIKCVISENGTIIPIHNIAVISAKNASHYIWSNADADDSNCGHKLSDGQYDALLGELEFITDKYNIRGIKSKHAEGKLGEMIKEMKSADKVEPKFHEGDWVVYECGEETATLQITRIVEETYVFSDDSTLGVVDEDTLRLWDVTQDAKNGDVLAVEPENDYPSPFIAIYKERGLDYFNSHCFISFDAKFYTGETGHDVKGIHPATKEQRDLLFQKMKEAGYEWNAEKKELKKIVDKEQIKKNLQDNSFRRMLEKKPADWSEEDESIVLGIEQLCNCASLLNIAPDKIDKIRTWLKSLRPQPKQEWSEEDERLFQIVIDILDRQNHLGNISRTDLIACVRKLKSLKPQKQWKPTEEQMEALKTSYLYWMGMTKEVPYTKGLESLYEQLKKLKC